MTPSAPAWYRNGIFGELGYATPYIDKTDSAKWYSNNLGILKLVNTFGKLVLGVMQQPDVWKSTPPQTSYFPQSVGKAVDRFRAILNGAMVPPGQADLRTVSTGMNPQPFLIYPIPYFRVRNPWAKQWASYFLTALQEAMIHANNLDSLQINSDLASTLSQYTDLVYRELAIELLGKNPADVNKPGFQLLDADYAAYNPAAVFNQIERVDTGAPMNFMLSPADLAGIVEGIPTPEIVPLLATWPLVYQPPADLSNVAGGSQSNVPASIAGTAATAASPAAVSTIPPPGP